MEPPSNSTKYMGPPMALSPFNQVLLYLVHLRHYLVNIFMALLFEIAKSTVSETLKLMESFFYDVQSPYVNVGTYEKRVKAGVHYFNELITWVIDGTEQEIHSSQNVYHENAFFSTKKGQHSVMLLIFICPTTGKFCI